MGGAAIISSPQRIPTQSFDAAAGTLTNHSETMVGVGGGARHLAVHPDGRTVYVNEEAGANITAYTWDAATGASSPPGSGAKRGGPLALSRFLALTQPSP